MKSIKEVTLKLQYQKSNVDKEAGIYVGGVAGPKYIKELSFDVSEDYNFDIDSGEFIKNGMIAIDITGSNRALKEFGKFLINMAMFKTIDEEYHEHVDNINDSNGNPLVNLTIRKNK